MDYRIPLTKSEEWSGVDNLIVYTAHSILIFILKDLQDQEQVRLTQEMAEMVVG